VAKKKRSQNSRYSGHLRSVRKSSTDDLISTIQMSPLRRQRQLGNGDRSHRDQQALDAAAHQHRPLGLAAVGKRVEGNR
jgi:hypothetical protein